MTTIVKHLKNSLELLDLRGCKNVNLDNIFEVVRNLTQLKILYYDVHAEFHVRCSACEECSNYVEPPKICGTCESLKKERPGLIIDDYYGHQNMIAKVDNYDDWENTYEPGL